MVNKPTYEELEQRIQELEKCSLEEEIENIFRLSPDLIGYGNLEGYFTKVNPSFTKKLGYSENEFYVKQFLSFLHEDDVKKTKKALLEAQKGIKNIYIENRYICKDGSYKWIDWHVESSVHKNTFLAIGREITERKQAEEALRENEKKFRAIYENIQDIYYQTDMKGKVVLVSPSAAALYGVDSTEELIGCDIAETFYYHPEDRKKSMEEIMKTGYLKNFLVTMKRSDGTPVSAEINSHFIYDKEGNIAGIEGIIRDLSGRKKAEETLRRYEDRYSIMVENSLNAIILYEQEKILFANKTFYNIFGYDSGELGGLTVDDILAPKVAEYVSELRRRRLAGEVEKASVYESKGRRKNGDIFDMEISVCMVPYQNKQCCMAFLSDISGRKKGRGGSAGERRKL